MAEPYSSGWWLDRLGSRLDQRAAEIRKFRLYYSGQQPLALASAKFREAFGQTYGRFADNFVALVVQAVEERLTVQGFRWDNDAGANKAWGMWQANQMDAQSQKAHRDALITGYSPVIVGPNPNGGKWPVIRVQKPEEVIVAHGDDPLVREVALKRWKTEDDRLLATLYYPDRLEKYQQTRTLRYANQYGRSYDLGGWEQRIVPGEPWPLPHDLAAVPVVTLVNDPDLDNCGTSEIASVVPLQDALNKLLVDMLVASEFAAFRQRWVTGMEIPLDPETQKPVEVFKASVQRVWQARDKEVKFGDFEQSDLAPYVSAIETVIQHMATTTRTPAHYLLGQSGTFPSGESLKATETGLTAKAKRDQRDWGEPWEEIERLGFRAMGDAKRAAYEEAETIWKDPEYRSEAEHVDALLKLKALGVPDEQLWSDAGYTPQQIKRFVALRQAQPPTPAPPAPTDGAMPMDGTPTGDMAPVIA
jgi:hypothetical protein